MRTANPTLNDAAFERRESLTPQQVMTLDGTVVKTGLLLAVLVISAAWTWGRVDAWDRSFSVLLVGSGLAGLAVAFVTVSRKEWSPVTAPLYAVLQGVVVGTVSAVMDRQYPGIVIQAVALTFGTLLSLLVAYRARLIQATENFRLGVFAATGAIALIYLVSFVSRFFGVEIPFIHESGIIGIVFSLVVVSVAALNLVLDFDFIERGVSAKLRLPKYMEWYAGFGLIVTLVWLYLEILRLLSKLRRR